MDCIIVATSASHRWTIRYKVGYCIANGVSPSQVSSQKRVSFQSPTINFVLLKKDALTLISPFQNGESVGLTVTRDKVLDCRYLLRRICAHVASVSTDNLYNHLLRRHLFLTSRFSIPRPPWSFGLQMISHLASRYFLFSSSLCQKNLDR